MWQQKEQTIGQCGSKRSRPPKTDCGIVYKQILIKGKLQKLEREVRNRADWEKSIQEAKVCIGLQCHPRRIRRSEEDKKEEEGAEEKVGGEGGDDDDDDDDDDDEGWRLLHNKELHNLYISWYS